MKELGIYIHLPFCMRKCRYCDFASFVADDHAKSRYVEAVCDEIDNEIFTAEGRLVDTIYFGGGTPSVVPPVLLEKILCKLKEKYTVAPDCEITMEVNPGTVSYEGLQEYKKIGINRLSIGMQSLNDNELRCLGRIHNSSEAIECFKNARRAGFSNISVDLMSAIPAQTIDSLRLNIEGVLAMDPEHISVYSLIVEEGTPFYEAYIEGSLEVVNEDISNAMDDLIHEMLKDAGYVRYEVSNYAKKGYESRHNSKYWNRQEYRGYGLSAASLFFTDDGVIRFTAERGFEDYCSSVTLSLIDRKNSLEHRTLSRSEEMEEHMFLGLRKAEGISDVEFKNRYGKGLEKIYGEVLKKYIELGLIVKEKNGEENRYFFSERGMSVSNPILADFLL